MSRIHDMGLCLLRLSPAQFVCGNAQDNACSNPEIPLPVVTSIRQICLQILDLHGTQTQCARDGQLIGSTQRIAKRRRRIDRIGTAPELRIETSHRAKQTLCKDLLSASE